MPTEQTANVLRHLRRAALRTDGMALTDGQLLDRFLSGRDEVAFRTLMQRHGPMVHGVCRRILRNGHDAEDAYQATFLVLVRKGTGFRTRATLGNWLYGVAYHTALKARAAAVKRRTKESRVTETLVPTTSVGDALLDLQPLLDQELNRLPDKYRAPVVLCELEGKSRKEVARQLGIPEGTLSSRLATARRLLGKRLTRYGLALSGAALVSTLTRATASASVPPRLLTGTLKAAEVVAAGKLTATSGVLSAKVVALTEGVIKSMLLSKCKLVLTVVLVIGCCVGGGSTVSCFLPGGVAVAADDKPTETQQRVDKLIVQLGSNDFQERAAAQTELEKIGLDAVAALEKAVKSDDKEVSRRAEAALAHIRTKLEDKAREKLFGKASKFGVDVFVAYLANQPTDVAEDWKLLEKLTTDLTKGAGKEKTKKLAELELLPAAKMGNGFGLVNRRAVGGAVTGKSAVQGALVADGSVTLTEGLVNTVVFANGDVTIDGSVVDSVIVCDGDVTIKADAIDTVILASGKVSIGSTIDTVIVAGGAVTTEKQAIAGSVKEKNALPLGTFKFSALADLGVEVAAKDGKVRVEKVGASPLAKALQKDDILLTVDKVEIGSVDALRRALRKGMVAGQAALKVQRGEKVVDVPVQLVD